MQELLQRAERIGAILKQRKETLAVAESSAGGLISAAMLSVAGASAYFIGGTVSYTRKSMSGLLNMTDENFKQMRGLSEPTALALARAAHQLLQSTWAISEIGAAGPTGSRYGDPAGKTAIAVTGPTERALIVLTGSDDRVANMSAFAAAALDLFEELLKQQPSR
ncbi:MAG TPA: CinA family protein [Candidatus Binataceae bacterium]|nr:CinA family protein [Candidatus Binataceae bacterium]